jgi:hypothetical protein
MKKAIRPLTLKERKKPAQLLFEGGFKNVSFQIGELMHKDGQDLQQSGPGLRPAILKKTEKIQFPIMIPSSVATFKGEGNIVCSVFGNKNSTTGLYDTFLVVRNMERLSSFNVQLRTIADLRKTDAELAEDRLGKGSSARQHNQINLCGVVIGSSFEDGENPKFHIQLRQTNNPDNVIHLIYDAKNAGAQVGRIRFGTIIYVEGEYAYRRVNVPVLNEEGKPVFKDNGEPVYQTDDNGELLKKIHSYIRISAPKEANLEFDTSFDPEDPPKWVADMAHTMNLKKARSLPVANTSTQDSLSDTDDL